MAYIYLIIPTILTIHEQYLIYAFITHIAKNVGKMGFTYGTPCIFCDPNESQDTMTK